MKESFVIAFALVSATMGIHAQTTSQVPEVVSENPIRKAYQRFSILGDSFGAYEGTTTTPGFLIQYPDKDVTEESQVYFRQLQAETGMTLRQNNSEAGTCVSYIGVMGNGNEVTVSFVNRSKGLQPANLFIVEGGTNDSYHYKPGEYKWSDWTDEDLNTWRGALACVFSNIKTRYHQFDVLFVQPDLNADMTEASRTICEHYGVPYCLLHDLLMVGVHPNVEGHHLMANQIANTLAEHLGWTVWDGEAENVKVNAGNIDQLYWRITLKAGQWQGAIFPFELNKDVAENLFGKGTEIAEYGKYDAENNTLHFSKVNGVKPNTPIMIRPAKAVGPVLLLKGVQTNASTIRKEVGSGDYRLRGMYSKTSITANMHNAIMIDGNGKGYLPTENFKVLPFQSYIYTSKPEVPNIVFDDETTTGVQGIKAIGQLETDGKEDYIYTLQGQKTNYTAKGNIYIINRKKVIVKQ